jgi:transglutaminase-like putative cysteine protease
MYTQAFVALILAQPLVANDRAYILDVAEVRRIEAQLTCDVECKDLRAREWIVFAAPAPELTGQVRVKSRMEPKAEIVKEKSPLHRPLFFARVPARTPELERYLDVRVTYEATLCSRRLRALKKKEKRPTIAPLATAEQAAALRSYGACDYATDLFQQWLDSRELHRRFGESELAFALRAFLDIQSYASYEFKSDMDRHASKVCRDGKSDCGGLSILLVSILRANNIPARTLLGHWAKSAREGAKEGSLDYHEEHVKAEFFVANIGWVPVDMSQAVRVSPAQSPLWYFGNDLGDFLTLHVDPDFEVDTIHFGKKPLANLQNPSYWVTGPGLKVRLTTTSDWRVRELP